MVAIWGQSFLASWGTISAPWGHPERPWEKQKGHEGGQSRLFIDVALVWGFYAESFVGTEDWNVNFLSVLFQVSFCTDSRREIWTLGAYKTKCSYRINATKTSHSSFVL